MNVKQVEKTALLVLGALIWGMAFAAQSVGSGYVEAYTFLACRSWLACIFLTGLLLVRRRLAAARKVRPAVTPAPHGTAVRGGIFCGIFLFAASAAQQMAVGEVSTAKASFLTALYVVLVPVCGIVLGRRPDRRIWLWVAVSVAGLYLLCMAGHDTLSLSVSELKLLLCALLFAVQILLVGHYSPKVDGVLLSLYQFLTTSVLSTVFMFLFEQPQWDQILGAGVAILYCGILSSGVGYTLQIIGQRGLDPTIASLAMCLESVFGALAGWALLGQKLTPIELTGCLLMFAAIVGSTLSTGKSSEPAGQASSSGKQ